jgi:putative thioredoxin
MPQAWQAGLSTLHRMTVIDVDEADFETEVLARSAQLPVVVDFWAPWCAPCRQLGPVLEQAAEARDGQVVLVKIDTDENPAIAQRFGIQGIPAVKAFVDGEVAAEFVGAQGPTQVEAFFDGLVPSATQALLDAGDEASLRTVLESEPANAEANFKLARLSYRAGDSEAALERLRDVTGNFAADGLAARIELERREGEHPRVGEAFATLDAGDTEAGLDILLEELTAAGDEDVRECLRRAIVAVLDELGVQHPLARDARRRLAAALY